MSGWDDGGFWPDFGTGFSVLDEPLRDFFEQEIDYAVEDPIYDEPEVLLFAVGTEKKGYKDHHFLGTNAEYLGKYHTKCADLNIFKGLDDNPHISSGEYSLVGELYRIPGKVLKGLDEKYKNARRTEVDILTEDGIEEEAWLYHMGSPVVVSDDTINQKEGIRVVNETHLEFLA